MTAQDRGSAREIADLVDTTLSDRTRSLLKLAFLVVATAGGMVLIRTLAQLESEFVGYAAAVRGSLGFVRAADGSPDWYLLTVAALPPSMAGGAIGLVLLVWTRALRTDVVARWQAPGTRGTDQVRRSLTRPRIRGNGRIVRRHSGCNDPAACPECCAKTNYLSDLLSLPHWDEKWASMTRPDQPSAGVSPIHPASLVPDRYDRFATLAFRELTKQMSVRALGIGLAVGFSHNRLLDALTVLAGTFEMHLFVLRELGKRPTLTVLSRIARNSLAALFVNLFLNREDVVALNVVVRKMAFGAQVTADLAFEVADHVSQLDFDLDELSLGGGLAELGKDAVFLGLTVGSAGMRAIGAFIDRCGHDLVQGCLSAGIAWHQAGSLAADILARDESHRERLMAEVTPFKCAEAMATQAGAILLNQVRELRKALRDRRIQLAKQARQHVFGF